jgi:ABC-type enterochelin transport system substrate-binding protein
MGHSSKSTGTPAYLNKIVKEKHFRFGAFFSVNYYFVPENFPDVIHELRANASTWEQGDAVPSSILGFGNSNLR